MSPITHRMLRPALARSFSVAICVIVLLPFSSTAQTSDETSLRRFIEEYYAAYARKDLNALLSSFSQKSPDFDRARFSFGTGFANNKIELISLIVEKVTVNGATGRVTVVVTWNTVDLKTGVPEEGSGKPLKRIMSCVKEGQDWKVWEIRAPESDLADALVSAKTAEERKALLAEDKEMVNSNLVRAVRALAVRFRTESNYPRAIECYQLVLELAMQVGDKGIYTSSLGGLGMVHQELGNFKESLEYYEKSARGAEELGDRAVLASVLNNIGMVYKKIENSTRALEYYQRALKIRQEMNDKAGMAPMLNNIGGIHRGQGNLAEALSYYQNSFKLADEIGDRRVKAIAVMSIGSLYHFQGNFSSALEYFQRGLKILEEIQDKPRLSNAHLAIGRLHFAQGNYAQALEYFQKSLKIAEEIRSKPVIGAAMANLGNLQQALGDFSGALEYFEKHLKLSEEMGEVGDVSNDLLSIGVLHREKGSPSLALQYLRRALQIAEQAGNNMDVANALAAIAEVHLDSGEYSQAVELATRGATISSQYGDLAQASESRIVAGKAYRGLNKPEQARQAFADAIAGIEELRSHVTGGTQERQRFFEKRTSPYYSMVDLLIGQQDPAGAFGYAERTKGRALLDTLQSGRVNITSAMTPGEQDEERKLNAEVNSLNIQIIVEKVGKHLDQARLADLEVRLARARLDQERFQINLYGAHPELKVHRAEMQPISLVQAGRLIPDTGTALLEYAVAEENTQLFVLTRRADVRGEESIPNLKVYTLDIKQKDLAERVEKFRGRLANQDFSFQELAREIYDLLLGPARAELQGKTNLIIVPDGVLWELPFQALQSAPKRFLIENAAISYAPSLTVLREMTRSHPAVAINSPTLLALGNPAIAKQTTQRINSVLMDERLDPLPEAERQVKELAKLYGPERSRIYIGAEAQEGRVKAEASGYGILHLAAHGILNDKNPMYSQVVLSQPEGEINEDGMLEAWEVMKLKLKAELVVLSACETARGRVGNGEGMIGLSWAFFVAGVPTTVASQWSVEAASTTELMVEFHRNLERHKSKAESLRQAMLKLLKSKEYSRPFYWAGFVVVGNGR